MSLKLKTVFIIIGILYLFFVGHINAFLCKENTGNLKLVYITDLNLYPTPSVSQREKHAVEKEDGLLIYESQAIFQEIVKNINQKLNPDLIVFGGNNISNAAKDNDVWNLFLDMTSELKANVLVVLGKNEIETQKEEELIHSLSSLGLNINNLKNNWWFYKFRGYLFLGLNSELFFNNEQLAVAELSWLHNILDKNKELKTIIFMHRTLLSPSGDIIENKHANKFFKILEEYPQVILMFGGGKYLNRIKLINKSVYVISSSPTVYPCSFKYIELTLEKLKIKTINISLKGVIKKAEESLIASNRAMTLFEDSAKDYVKVLKKYVLGDSLDSNFEILYSDLSNR